MESANYIVTLKAEAAGERVAATIESMGYRIRHRLLKVRHLSISGPEGSEQGLCAVEGVESVRKEAVGSLKV